MNTKITALLAFLITALGLGIHFYKKVPQISISIDKALSQTNVVPVVVIGSGPAGLSAALYTARSAIYTVVFQGKKPGGQLTETTYVENWPGTQKLLGSQLIEQNRKQAEKFGALMVHDSIVSADFSRWPCVLTSEEGAEIHALSVIIATGSNPKKLNDTRKVPGEDEYWGYGVTTCAVCDAPFYKDKKVVVVGGGDSAVEEATLLASYAEKVTLLVRGTALRAAPAMQARLTTSPKIAVLYSTEITEVMGNGKHVTGVKLLNTKDKKVTDFPVDGVFLAIGHKPNAQIFNVKKDPDTGYIIVDCHNQSTSVPGVFAAGDVADHVYRQAGVAAGDGIKAALDAVAFLQAHGYNEGTAKALEQRYWFPAVEKTAAPLQKIKTNKDFDALAKEHPFMVIDVGAEHCSGCTALMPVVQAVAAQFSDRVHFVQIDTGEAKELVKRFAIKGIPVLLIFKKDKLIARYDQPLFTKRQLSAIVSQLLAEG